MKRIYLIPTDVICIKPSNKESFIHCSKKNLTELLSKYDIKVTGDRHYRFVELPKGWDVRDDNEKSITFVDQYNNVCAAIMGRVIYI